MAEEIYFTKDGINLDQIYAKINQLNDLSSNLSIEFDNKFNNITVSCATFNDNLTIISSYLNGRITTISTTITDDISVKINDLSTMLTSLTSNINDINDITKEILGIQ